MTLQQPEWELAFGTYHLHPELGPKLASKLSSYPCPYFSHTNHSSLLLLIYQQHFRGEMVMEEKSVRDTETQM